jgi:regulation of enolase protein 1 (concanavalin A-like superfamily)
VAVGLTTAKGMVKLVTRMGTKYYNYMMMMTTHTAPSILVNVSDCKEREMTNYLIGWAIEEQYRVNIMADSPEEALQKFHDGEFDLDEAKHVGSDLIDWAFLP